MTIIDTGFCAGARLTPIIVVKRAPWAQELARSDWVSVVTGWCLFPAPPFQMSRDH